ncbi:MAG: hypothetical protein QM426_07000 [Euryarchaeota archaeon]|nr:hypothetical protein [Euryarchaeota archaeon]
MKALAGENTNNEKEIISELPSGLFPEFIAFMWHGDTFEIPAGTVRLFERKPARPGFYLRRKSSRVAVSP